jgi:hypothetical protein
MRTQVVTLGEQQYTMQEFTVKKLRTEVLPKLLPILSVFQGSEKAEDALAKIPQIEETLAEIFPGTTAEMFDDAYPSELEQFVQAAVDVNFFGLKKLFGQALSLSRTPTLKS